MRYVYLQRRDRVAQAVSRHKAEISGTWHLGFEEAAKPKVPVYDFAAVNGHLREVEDADDQWRRWFAARGIRPFDVAYEDLSADPQGVTQQVLAFLGLQATHPLQVTNRKMADGESADWVARFRAEAEQNGS
jgi:LPS sulfotransferase NodH